jgi:hypothetical protein
MHVSAAEKYPRDTIVCVRCYRGLEGRDRFGELSVAIKIDAAIAIALLSERGC